MGVAITLDECEELAKEEGIDKWTLGARFAHRMLPQVFRPDHPVFDVQFAREHRLKLEGLVEGAPWRRYSPRPIPSAGFTSSGRRRRRPRSTPPATRSARMNCRPSRNCSPKITWWTSSWTTHSARGTPLSPRRRSNASRKVPGAKTNFARPLRCRAARGSISGSSKARTESGLPPPAPSRAGRTTTNELHLPRPVHGERAFRGGDVRSAGGLAIGRGKD